MSPDFTYNLLKTLGNFTPSLHHGGSIQSLRFIFNTHPRWDQLLSLRRSVSELSLWLSATATAIRNSRFIPPHARPAKSRPSDTRAIWIYTGKKLHANRPTRLPGPNHSSRISTRAKQSPRKCKLLVSIKQQ